MPIPVLSGQGDAVHAQIRIAATEPPLHALAGDGDRNALDLEQGRASRQTEISGVLFVTKIGSQSFVRRDDVDPVLALIKRE